MDLATAFRIVHITAGVVALASFPIPLVVKKGSALHRRAGWVYAVAMSVVVVAAFTVCGVRLADDNADNDGLALFLAYVGLLAGVNVVVGLRALRERNKKRAGASDDTVSLAALAVLLAASVGLVAGGFTLGGGALWWAFGAFGVYFAVRNIRDLRRAPAPRGWLRMHLTNMCGACIGTVTAVLVVNADHLGVPPGVMPFVWLAPGVLGGAGIVFWSRRYASAASAP